MPRYAPLPSVSIDPRDEAQIVQQASQRVYEASGQTLNDFSSGNPLAALLEGQAFAQGEFLFWANQLPQSILIEWIGPFLGAMRRLGTPATAQLVVNIPPSNSVTVIPIGSAFTTDANLTGGESFSFITSEEISIPSGESTAKISVSSQYVGSIYNVPAFSITTSSAVNVNGLQVINPLPAVGGSDVETYQEVQERFFTLIRRKNPVSSQDWQDFFTDFYGIGTLTSVQPNRSSELPYSYLTDYLLPNGQVSFFVLGPGGVELTPIQLQRGQNAVNFLTSVENRGHLYPITLSQVQYNITLSIDANSSFGVNPKDTSLDFRNRLFDILTPGSVFPSNINPTVSDVDAAFYNTFNGDTRYVNPHIEISAAYNTPPGLYPGTAVYTQVYTYAPSEYLLNKNDLVELPLPVSTFYPVLQSFTPYSSQKEDQTIYGNLELQQIVYLVPGTFNQGQVVYWSSTNNQLGDNQLHVILDNISITSSEEISGLITSGQISGAMAYSPWTVGNSYVATTGTGTYAPQIVQYDYPTPITNNIAADGQFVPPGPESVSSRPGTFVWVVAQNFTLGTATNTISAAQPSLISTTSVVPQQLIPGTSYSAGTWVSTPQIGSGPDNVADHDFYYIDPRLGVVVKYAYVNATFTYLPNSSTETVSDYFDTLVLQKIISEVVVSTTSLNQQLPVYKYKPRFPATTYLEYKPDTLSLPLFYIASSYFTPNSTDIQILLSEGLVFPLFLSTPQQTAFLAYLKDSTSITPTRMFRFWKGDRTFFRRGTNVLSYTATSNVTPLFNFNVYLQNGIFVQTMEYLPGEFEVQQYIPYYNPSYDQYSEDTILAEDNRNIYRVMRAFSPSPTLINWTQTTVADSARNQEYAGNLLRYVDDYTCEQPILSQLGLVTSAIKLGIAQITLIPKNKGRFTDDRENLVFVWENTATLSQTPQLSWYTGTNYALRPPVYGNGTLAL